MLINTEVPKIDKTKRGNPEKSKTKKTLTNKVSSKKDSSKIPYLKHTSKKYK